jgi:hypothetical protein
MTSAAIAVLAATLCASSGEAPLAAAPPPPPLLPADPVAPPSPSADPATSAPASETVAPPPLTYGSTLRGFASLGAATSGKEQWAGYGGSLVLDLWMDPPDWAAGAVRLSLEGGAYGAAAAIGAVFAFGKRQIRPYLGASIGLGVFGGDGGFPVTLLAGVEWNLPWHLSLALEGRGHVAGSFDDDGNFHKFAAASALVGIGLRL